MILGLGTLRRLTTNGGHFFDSLTGLSSPPKMIFVSKKDLKSKDKFSTTAHGLTMRFTVLVFLQGRTKKNYYPCTKKLSSRANVWIHTQN